MELMLFENEPDGAREAQEYGIPSFLVDFEVVDKENRQKGYDTQIRPGTPSDLRAMADIEDALTWCRINRLGAGTEGEIHQAVDAGAAGIFLPMVESPEDVESFLLLLDGRCSAGILVETTAALDCAAELAEFPLSKVFFGLNDFAICRGNPFIFQAVLDGSVEKARNAFSGKEFGFGGMTAIDAGHPVPARMLMQEMARLECDFTFLRRSYRRDILYRDGRQTIAGILNYWEECRKRPKEKVLEDKRTLDALLKEISRG